MPARRPRDDDPANRQAYDRTRAAGAKVLGPSEHAPSLWVRFRFHVGPNGLEKA